MDLYTYGTFCPSLLPYLKRFFLHNNNVGLVGRMQIKDYFLDIVAKRRVVD